MTIQLRPYQQELVEGVRAAMAAGARTVLMQLPTGGGKSATATAPIEECTRRGRRSVFVAHLDALIDDTYERLVASGVHCGIVQGDRPTDPTAPCQVASLQTLARRGAVACPDADLVFLDECHRAETVSVRAVLQAYPHARLIGLTATPQRGDGRPLGREAGGVFEKMVQGPTVRWLTEHNYLVPCDVLAPARFAEKGLAADPVEAYEQYASGTRALVFAGTAKEAEVLAERFEERGWATALVLGDTPRAVRRRARAELEAGDLKVIVGVGVFIEGWDSPSVETIILARAFRVTMSFLQAIGRGLRTSPATGKEKCTVIDLRGAVNLHGLPDEDRRWSLDGKAVVRLEALPALARCPECMAIFRPSRECPRCGSPVEVKNRVSRNLSRNEKQELRDIRKEDPVKMDRSYLEALKTIAWRIAQSARLRHMAPFRKQQFVREWAIAKFKKARGRDPLPAALGGFT